MEGNDMKPMKIALIHPGRGKTYQETIENLQHANDACQRIRWEGHIPVAPLVAFHDFGWLDESEPGHREAGLAAGHAILKGCGLDAAILYRHDIIHYGAGNTEGMIADLREIEGTVVDFMMIEPAYRANLPSVIHVLESAHQIRLEQDADAERARRVVAAMPELESAKDE